MPGPPSLRSFDLNLLVLFDALYRERKLAAAAAMVGLSQPGASQALARLREAFDDPLFVRSGAGMEPTAQAHTLAPMVREALSSLERGLSAVRSFDPAHSEREFRLALAEIGELVTLPAIVTELGKTAPNVRVVSVRGSRSEIEFLAAKGDVDLCLDFQPPATPLLHYEQIAEEELVVIARLDHPRIRGAVSLEQFFSERHVVINLESTAFNHLADAVKISMFHQRKVLCVCVHASAMPAVVMQTDAIATVPRSIVNRPPFAGALQLLEPPMPLFKLPVFVFWHVSLEADAGHAWLRSQLVRRFWTD